MKIASLILFAFLLTALALQAKPTPPNRVAAAARIRPEARADPEATAARATTASSASRLSDDLIPRSCCD